MSYLNYSEVINEHVDIHSKNANILLKLNEAERTAVLDKVATRLYNSIVAKVDNIDYGNIPATAGDITALPNYNDITEAINTIETLLIECRESTESINILKDAVTNVIALKPQFTFGFKIDIDIIKLLYNNIVLAIIASTSHLLIACTDYIVNTNTDFKLNLDKAALKNTKDNMLFQSLVSFNNACNNGKMRKLLQDIIREADGAKGFVGFIAMNGLLAVGIVMMIIPILRTLIYFFYNSRVTVSDYLDMQAEVLKMNVLELEDSERKDRKEIIKKQNSIIANIERMSDKIRVKHNTSTVKTKKELESVDKLSANDLIDDSKKPDSLF